MPTGYTAGILDGDIKDFKQFATLCMRAFGATIHMRDEEMDKPYVPRVPSGYYSEQIEKANQLLKDAESLTNDGIIDRRKVGLFAEKKYHEEAIVKKMADHERLDAILKDVEAWQPPTDDHTGVKEFMIDQLTKTMQFDGSTRYHDEKLVEINEELESLSADQIRMSMKAKAYKDLSYHQEELNKDIERCNNSNQWVETFLASLEQKQQPA